MQKHTTNLGNSIFIICLALITMKSHEKIWVIIKINFTEN